jgi:hypothetical protein
VISTIYKIFGFGKLSKSENIWFWTTVLEKQRSKTILIAFKRNSGIEIPS